LRRKHWVRLLASAESPPPIFPCLRSGSGNKTPNPANSITLHILSRTTSL